VDLSGIRGVTCKSGPITYMRTLRGSTPAGALRLLAQLHARRSV